jgi:hypothetical protein
MDILNFKGMSLEDIRDNLEAGAVGHESLTFVSALTEDELHTLEKEYIEVSKTEMELVTELDAIAKPIKDKLKEIKALKKGQIQTMKLGGEYVTDDVFLIPDYEKNMMYQYYHDGRLVGTRPMNRSERQLSLNSIKHFKEVANG